MSKEEMVSIIIPLYNKEKYIEETIENIKRQTYTNWELIIVDDGATDKSYEIAKKYQSEKILLIKSEKNEGAAIARNKGIEIAKGRYICFQDADDLWNEKKLEKQIDFMKENNCAFSYTGFQYMKEDGTVKKNKVKIQTKLEYEEALKNIRILTISTMFDTNKINKELLIMPNICAEDIATWWNILKKGYIAYGIDESLVYYRNTKKSLSSNKIKSAKNRWNLYRKYEKFPIYKAMYYFLHYAIYAIVKRI